MKITVLYGNERQGSTFHLVRLLKECLSEKLDISYTEFMLPRDLPEFCKGCFTCFRWGEEKCPHRAWSGPIEKALLEADGIIVSSPTYAMEVSGALKNCFDHLCYQWIPHRPRAAMFSKVGVALSTTAGGGGGSVTRTIRKNLVFMGVPKVFRYSRAVAAMRWEEVSPKTKKMMERDIRQLAQKMVHQLMRRASIQTGWFTRLFFGMMKMMISGYPADHPDRLYWEEQGWLAKQRPF